MRNTEANFFIFIAAIMLGLLISLNINITKFPKKVVLSVKEYQDAYEERARLQSDLIALKKEKESLLEKKDKNIKSNTENELEVDSLIDELEANNNILGVNDVQGEGLIVTLEDGNKAFESEVVDSFIQMQRTIHDNDMTEVLNDIKYAGAEAISINDHRVIFNSSVYCGGQFLIINGVKTPAPFRVKMIGDIETIKTRLLASDGALAKMKTRGIQVSIEEEKNLKISSYIKNINYNNIKIIKND